MRVILDITPVYCFRENHIEIKTRELDKFTIALQNIPAFWKNPQFYAKLVDATGDHIKTQFPYREFLEREVYCIIRMKILTYYRQDNGAIQVVKLDPRENFSNLPTPNVNQPFMISVQYERMN